MSVATVGLTAQSGQHDTMTNDKISDARKTSLATYASVAAASVLVGFGFAYAVLKNPNPVELATSTSTETVSQKAVVSSANPLATGEMLTFVFKKTPEPLPAFAFEDGTGAVKTLADWKGKVVLLNLWATWCTPCRKEMPALDRLQKELGSDRFEVVALSVDRQGVAASKKFLDETKVSNLKLYVESTSKSIGLLRAPGLPTTILIDGEGREIGRLAGPAEWDSADAKKLIQSVLK
jgi:thiol-disulfide isomerase/thioredoxin